MDPEETDQADEFSELASEFTNDFETNTTISTTVPIDSETSVKIKEVLEALSKTEELIHHHVKEIQLLKQKKNELRAESIRLMTRHKIDETKIKSTNSRYRLRQVKRKTNPFAKKKLPESLARYFIMCNRDSVEDAKRRALEMIEWINKHVTEESFTSVLSKYKMKE